MKKNNIRLFSIVFLLFFLLMINSVNSSIFKKKFDTEVGSADEIIFEDLNNDGKTELIVRSGNTINVISLESGEHLWDYTKGNMKDISIGDLDGNGLKEILFISGRTTSSTPRYFVWAIDSYGKALIKYPPSRVGLTIELNSITDPYDFNANGYKEIIAGASPGIVVFKDTYDKINWYNRDKISDTIKDIIIIKTTEDGDSDILARSFSRIYLVDSTNGEVKWNYTNTNGIISMYFKALLEGANEEIIFLSRYSKGIEEGVKIGILSMGGNVTKEKIILKKFQEKKIEPILFLKDINSDNAKEIFLSIENELFLLDSDLVKEKNYTFPDDEIVKGIFYSGNFDLEKGENEIIIFTNKKLYVFSKNLSRKKFEYDLYNDVLGKHELSKVYLRRDIDNDGEEDIILNSFGRIYVFNVNESFLIKKSADELYLKALGFYEEGNYTNASLTLSQARKVYAGIKNVEGIIKSKTLFLQILRKTKEEKLKIANSIYEQGKMAFNNTKYDDALNYLNSAKQKFNEVAGEKEKISQIDELIDKINEIKNKKEKIENSTSTTFPTNVTVADITPTTIKEKIPVSSTKTTNSKENPTDNSTKNPTINLLVITLLLIIILIIFLVVKKKKDYLQQNREKKVRGGKGVKRERKKGNEEKKT